MNKKNVRASVLAIAGSALLMVGITAPANAASTSGTLGADEDCGIFAGSNVTVCVPHGGDLHAAVKEQTGQTIVIGGTRAAAPAAAGPDSVQTSYLLGRIYDDQNYGGSYYEFYGLGTGCTATASFQWPDIGSAWYGRVSSFHSYSACKTKIYETTGYGGASYGYYADSSYVGNAMNDRTKSIKFHS
jgi:hypothetical protein